MLVSIGRLVLDARSRHNFVILLLPLPPLLLPPPLPRYQQLHLHHRHQGIQGLTLSCQVFLFLLVDTMASNLPLTSSLPITDDTARRETRRSCSELVTKFM